MDNFKAVYKILSTLEKVERCTILGGSFKIIGIKLASADCNGKASLKYCLLQFLHGVIYIHYLTSFLAK